MSTATKELIEYKKHLNELQHELDYIVAHAEMDEIDLDITPEDFQHDPEMADLKNELELQLENAKATIEKMKTCTSYYIQRF